MKLQGATLLALCPTCACAVMGSVREVTWVLIRVGRYLASVHRELACLLRCCCLLFRVACGMCVCVCLCFN